MNYLLALLGIAINFISKYSARNEKKQFDLKFWLKDNWPELVQSVLFILAIMIMLGTAEFDTEDFYTWLNGIVPLPKGVVIPAQLVAPFLTGLGINHVVYWYNKRFIKPKK